LAALVEAYRHEDRFGGAAALVPEGLAAADAAGADDVMVRLLLASGSIALEQGESRDALTLHERALQVAEQSDDRESEALAHQALAETRLMTGPLADGLHDAKLADSLLRELGQRPLVHRNEHLLAWHLWLTGSSGEALRVASSSALGARELGNRRLEAAALSASAQASLSGGDLAGAAEAAADAVELAHEAGAARLELGARLWHALVLAELGALGRLEEEQRAAAAVSDLLGGRYLRGPVLALRGSSLAAAGNVEAARATFAEAVEITAGAQLQLVFASRLELLCWERLEDAAGLDAVALHLGEIEGPDTSPHSAWAELAAGLAAFVRGDHATAAERGQAALGRATAASEAPVAWRSRLLIGRALEAQVSGDEAADELHAAASILSGMAEGLQQELRAGFCARPDVAYALAFERSA
jgi:hypothetical protein